MVKWTGTNNIHRSTYKGFSMIVRRGTSCWFAVIQSGAIKKRYKCSLKRSARGWCQDQVDFYRAFEKLNMDIPF
jgi:hypothetical protein